MVLDGSTGRLVAVDQQAQGQDQGQGSQGGPRGSGIGLPFDEEAKLVYGVVLSLRNMVKKLSGR